MSGEVGARPGGKHYPAKWVWLHTSSSQEYMGLRNSPAASKLTCGTAEMRVQESLHPPSYPAGHAAIACACATVLKATSTTGFSLRRFDGRRVRVG